MLSPMISDSTKSTFKAFLRGVSGLLFGIAGISFWVGGRAISEFSKTDRVLGEMAGIFIAIVCGALGMWAKSAGEEDTKTKDTRFWMRMSYALLNAKDLEFKRESRTRMRALLIVLAICVPAIAQSKAAKSSGPDCSGGWPMKMTFVQLKNAGLVDNNSIDFSKAKTVRLASEKIGKDLWHQVYRVTFTKSYGDLIEAIAIHDASTEECSMTGVEVFVISKHLSPEGK
jgi:hypothetical protein